MANRTGYPSQNLGSVGRYYCEIKLKLNGASAPTILAGGGVLSTTSPPAHVGGSNVVAVTLRDAWVAVDAHAVDERDDVGAGTYATLGTFANEGTATPLTFKVNTFLASGSVSNDSSLVVVITLALRNSNEAYGT
jgi:hypothetical protein